MIALSSILQIIFILASTMTQQISRTVNGWTVLPPSQKSVFLVGFSSIGKTTFAELVNKYQHGKPHPALTFEKDKYVLENVISVKAIKVQTTLPNSYPSIAPEGLTLVDVPCYCLTPESLKKWTLFDQKLTVNLMTEHSRQVGYLLFIEENKTRTNINPWKKTFYGWLDMFREYPDELLNSVGWIITKCPPEITEESVEKRLRNLQEAIKVQKPALSAMVDKLFDCLINKKHFYIFKKGSGNEEVEGVDIRNIYQQLGTLPSYLTSQDHLSEKMNWTGEDQAALREYLEKCEARFGKVLEALQDIFGFLSKSSLEEFEVIKKKHYSSQAIESVVSEEVKNKLRESNNPYQLWELIKAFKSVRFTVSDQKSDLLTVLHTIMALPIFNTGNADALEFQLIIEAIQFKTNSFQYQFEKVSAAIKKLFVSSVDTFYSQLANSVQDNDSEQFYESSIELLQEDSKLTPKASEFLTLCRDSVLKFKSSKKLLTKLLKDIDIKQYSKGMKDIQVNQELLFKMGSTIEKEGHFKQAFKIYGLISCPGESLRCFEKIEIDSQILALEYVDTLINFNLFEEARKSCYKFSALFGFSSRGQFGKKEQEVMDLQSKPKTNLLLQRVKLSAEDLGLIEQQTLKVIAQLKDS